MNVKAEKIFLSEVGEKNIKCMTKSQIKTLEDIFLVAGKIVSNIMKVA